MNVRVRPVWVLLACVLLAPACSRSARAGRHASASKKAYDKARAALLAGDVATASDEAQKALSSATRASDLMPTGPEHPLAKRLDCTRLLASSFEDPCAAVGLWYRALGEGDDALVRCIFDHRRTLAEVFPDVFEKMSDAEQKRLEQPLVDTLNRTIENYAQTASAMQAKTQVENRSGDEASVRCTLVIPSMKLETSHSIHLHHRDGIWRVYDFTMGRVEGKRVTALLKERSWGDDRVEELSRLLQGKDLFAAMAAIRDLNAQMAMDQEGKPLRNRYVRTLEPWVLGRDGAKVDIEKGALLRVLEQKGTDPAAALLLVRTPESDAAESAVGEIPQSKVEPVGSDETELWGTAEGVPTQPAVIGP